MEEWAKHAEAEAKIVKAVAIVEAKQDVQLPELPANLKRCLAQSKQGLTPGNKKNAKAKPDKAAGKKAKPEGGAGVVQAGPPSADKLVLKQLEDQKRRQACAEAILRWYDQLRRQKVATK